MLQVTRSGLITNALDLPQNHSLEGVIDDHLPCGQLTA